ncbi:MAG: TRAP transporter large permease subunit [Deltaproteobacteria bacterium]|nr:TRAP transporter large permease subunit [Deltaproteobacteria bacterium]
MSPDQIAAIVMMGLLLAMVICGIHLAFALMFLALVFGLIFQGTSIFPMSMLKFMGMMESEILIAVPLFVFMGTILEKSEVAEGVYQSLYELFGPVRGGLAFATIITCTIFASCTGVIAATVTTMTLLAVPSMVKRKYDKGLATGCVCAGGSLGILIPPSVMLVMYGPMANLSVAQLFAAALFPGVLLAGLYLLYIGLASWLRPSVAPAILEEERTGRGKILWLRAAKHMLPSLVLIIAVLGSIIGGVASPTEASGVGAFVALIIAAAYRRLTLQNVKEAAYTTLTVTVMVFFIIAGAAVFNAVFLFLGAHEPPFRGLVRVVRHDVHPLHPGLLHILAGTPLHRGSHFPPRGRQAGVQPPLVRYPDLPQPPDVLSHASLCLCDIFRERGISAGNQHVGYLPGRHPIRVSSGRLRGRLHPVPGNHPLASAGHPGRGGGMKMPPPGPCRRIGGGRDEAWGKVEGVRIR